MKIRTISVIAAAGISVIAGTVQAESFQAKEKRSYTDVRSSRLVSACVDVIEDYHPKEARLFLNKQGQFSTENGGRAFSIQGWVWRGGARTQATYNCAAQDEGHGLMVNIDYNDGRQLAEIDSE